METISETLGKTFAIAAEQPVLAGHFPGYPILPGVLLLAFARDTIATATGRACRIQAIVRHKFVEPVLPGQSVRVECTLKPAADGTHANAACRYVNADGKLVAKGDYQVRLTP
ncbi:MAG: hypothetical protein ACKN9T_07470 [Candidatus Methylumidiphilus sp.]